MIWVGAVVSVGCRLTGGQLAGRQLGRKSSVLNDTGTCNNSSHHYCHVFYWPHASKDTTLRLPLPPSIVILYLHSLVESPHVSHTKSTFSWQWRCVLFGSILHNWTLEVCRWKDYQLLSLWLHCPQHCSFLAGAISVKAVYLSRTHHFMSATSISTFWVST